jgi:hypothetical protein
MHDDGIGWDEIHSAEQDRKIKALEARIAKLESEKASKDPLEQDHNADCSPNRQDRIGLSPTYD